MNGYRTIQDVIATRMDHWLETDPDKILAYELADAEDRLMRARRKYQAEPDEPCRIDAVIRAEAEVATLQRLASRFIPRRAA